MPRPSPIKTQFATLADAARTHQVVSTELIRKLAEDPEHVPPSYVRAVMVTNQHLTDLLLNAPTLIPESPTSALVAAEPTSMLAISGA